MNKIRLLSRLDIKGPNLIKGVRFEGLRVIGDPEEFAIKYYDQGIDELIYIDTVASLYGRNNLLEFVKKVGKKTFVPITVGGGIRSVDDAQKFLNAGADKVAINSAAVNNPKILEGIAKRFGSQCLVLIVDAKRIYHKKKWEVYTLQGREKTNVDVIEWIKKGISLGVGEILVTSIDQDGTLKGYDLELIKEVSENVNIPFVACGGGGSLDDINDVLKISENINIALGTALHKNILKINEIKSFLKKKGYSTRTYSRSE